MIRFMGGLRCKKRVNSVIIGVIQKSITDIISLYASIFLKKNKYNVKQTNMYLHKKCIVSND